MIIRVALVVDRRSPRGPCRETLITPDAGDPIRSPDRVRRLGQRQQTTMLSTIRELQDAAEAQQQRVHRVARDRGVVLDGSHDGVLAVGRRATTGREGSPPPGRRASQPVFSESERLARSWPDGPSSASASPDLRCPGQAVCGRRRSNLTRLPRGRNMNDRHVKKLVKATDARGRGRPPTPSPLFGDTTAVDPFLLLDDFRNEKPADYIGGFPWHPHRGIETIRWPSSRAASTTAIAWATQVRSALATSNG